MLCRSSIIHDLPHGCWKKEKYNVSLFVRSHEWTRMPTQYKSVKNKRVAIRRMVGGHNECVQRIERVFFHAHRVLFDARRRHSLTRRFIPEHYRPSSGMGTAVARGSQARKVRKKKRKEKEFREERGESEIEKEIEKNVMQSGKPCRSPFVRGHASYWFRL